VLYIYDDRHVIHAIRPGCRSPSSVVHIRWCSQLHLRFGVYGYCVHLREPAIVTNTVGRRSAASRAEAPPGLPIMPDVADDFTEPMSNADE
jgi:hypothetical protein